MADAVFGNDFEPRERLRDYRAREGVITAEVSVELAREFEHARFRQRAAFAHEFKVRRRQHLVVDAGRVLK